MWRGGLKRLQDTACNMQRPGWTALITAPLAIIAICSGLVTRWLGANRTTFHTAEMINCQKLIDGQTSPSLSLSFQPTGRGAICWLVEECVCGERMPHFPLRV